MFDRIQVQYGIFVLISLNWKNFIYFLLFWCFYCYIFILCNDKYFFLKYLCFQGWKWKLFRKHFQTLFICALWTLYSIIKTLFIKFENSLTKIMTPSYSFILRRMKFFEADLKERIHFFIISRWVKFYC